MAKKYIYWTETREITYRTEISEEECQRLRDLYPRDMREQIGWHIEDLTSDQIEEYSVSGGRDDCHDYVGE